MEGKIYKTMIEWWTAGKKCERRLKLHQLFALRKQIIVLSPTLEIFQKCHHAWMLLESLSHLSHTCHTEVWRILWQAAPVCSCMPEWRAFAGRSSSPPPSSSHSYKCDPWSPTARNKTGKCDERKQFQRKTQWEQTAEMMVANDNAQCQISQVAGEQLPHANHVTSFINAC